MCFVYMCVYTYIYIYIMLDGDEYYRKTKQKQ